MIPIVQWYVLGCGIFTSPVFFSFSYLLQFARGFLEPCAWCPPHLRLWMSPLKFGGHMIVVELES